MHSLKMIDSENFPNIKDIATEGSLVQSGRELGAASGELFASAKAQAAEAAATAFMYVLSFIIAAIASGVGIAFFITRSITKPINQLVDDADELAKGNLSHEVTVSENKDELGTLTTAVSKVAGTIQKFGGELDVLTNAAAEGKLETRGDPEKFEGDFAKLVTGVNSTLDNVIGPLNVAAEYVDRISKGDIPEEITDEYKGDFNEIKNNLNEAIKAVNGLVTEAGMLTEAAVEGRLATRGDASKFGGDFAKIVQGVNDTLDAVIGPLNVAAEYVDRISKGDIPEKITEEYKGDFDEIKNNLNVMIDRVGAQISNLTNIPTPIMTIDKDFNVTYMNTVGAKLVGLTSEQCEGKKCYDLFKTPHCQTSECRCAQAMQRDEIVTGETVADPSGLNMPIQYTAAPIKDRDGNMTGALEYVADITESKKAMDDAREMVDYLNNIPTPVIVVDKELSVQFMNPAGAAAVGMTPEACVGKKCFNLFNTPHCNTPDCQVAKAMQENGIFTSDTIAKLPSGELPIRYTGAPIKDAAGNVVGGLEYVMDISEENQAVAEVELLVEAAVNGKLDARGNPDNYKIVGFRDIIKGINDTLDAVIGPLNVAAEYVDRISKGDIPEEITDEYKGDFNEIKNNLNDAIKAINGLTAEAGMLAEAAVEGRLDTRGDASKFGGDFAKIVQGVNETLDGVIGPLNVAAEYVDRISKGDIPEEITDEYKGDFNEIKNNLNEAIKAINGLVAEAGMLNEAAVEGRLDTRGDASKFGGDFAKIVQGVNDTLDAVIGPLQVAADYVDKISRGDIPEEITDEYKGDFNEIKNNLNEAIKAVNGLVSETGMLAEAAVEGKLETRGDADKFGGDFAKIVQGVNGTLDAVIEPVHAVMRVCDAFAGGNLSERVTLEAKGEFMALTETLNNFGDTLQTIINDVINVAQNMAAGDLTADFVAETPGEFNAIRDNINKATDNLSDLVAELQGTIDNVASIGKESASSVEQVNSGMQQISSASQQIAKGAQETSSTVNEAAKEVKETNAVLQQMQSNAEESNKFAVESAESAKEMNEMANKSAEGMKEIQDAIGDTVAIIKNLGSSLEEVGKTTEVIEGIAEQTNLLALNAAIEAARAGEHGRGFAVVAEEVRKLAENSKKSTGDIDTMIKNLQEEMEKVVKATDAVTQRAEVGREDLEKAVASVEKTAGMIDDIKNRMEQITEGARKGAESIEKVSKGVDEIASSAEQAASSSEESSSAVEQQTAAAEQLSGGIKKLSDISEQAAEMIAKFKLKVGSSEGKSKKEGITSSATEE